LKFGVICAWLQVNDVMLALVKNTVYISLHGPELFGRSFPGCSLFGPSCFPGGIKPSLAYFTVLHTSWISVFQKDDSRSNFM